MAAVGVPDPGVPAVVVPHFGDVRSVIHYPGGFPPGPYPVSEVHQGGYVLGDVHGDGPTPRWEGEVAGNTKATGVVPVALFVSADR